MTTESSAVDTDYLRRMAHASAFGIPDHSERLKIAHAADEIDLLRDVRSAAIMLLNQTEPCEICAEDSCDPDVFCPCDFGCHNGVEVAHTILQAAINVSQEVS